jgi:hypothetical protein
VKSNPHASQNCPERFTPQRGQNSSGTSPAPPATVAPAGPPHPGAGAGVGARLGAALIRTPHTSQKSSLAES